MGSVFTWIHQQLPRSAQHKRRSAQRERGVPRRRLRFECLEERTLLAHTISIAVGGSATIPAGATEFSDMGDYTIAPSALQSATTDILLEANTDVDFFSSVSGTNGHNLAVYAGRSIIVNGNVGVTSSGLLNFLADADSSHLIVDANRDPGTAVISTALGSSLTGSAVNITIDAGSGQSTPTSGDITLASVMSSGTGGIIVANEGPNAGSINVIGSGITSSGGGVELVADNMSIGANINAGTKSVTLMPNSTGRSVELGNKPGTDLGLLQSELNHIQAGILAVDTNLGNGNIQITAPITGTGGGYNSTLYLTTGGTITQSPGSTLTFAVLEATGVNGVDLEQANSVGDLGGQTTSPPGYVPTTPGPAAFTFVNAGPLTVIGIYTNGGDINLRSGNLTIGSVNGEGINAQAGTVRLVSTGRVTLNAGGGDIEGANLAITAAGNVDLTAVANEVGGNVAINDSTGFVRLVEKLSFTVGTVRPAFPSADPAGLFAATVAGVTTVGSDIALQSSGALTLGDGNPNAVVAASGSGGDVRLSAGTSVQQSPSGGGKITAGALLIYTYGEVDLSQTPNAVSAVLAFDSYGTAIGLNAFIRFVNLGSIAVGSVGGLASGALGIAGESGVTNFASDVGLVNLSGSMTIATGNVASQDVRLSSAGSITENAAGEISARGALGVSAAGNVDLSSVNNFVGGPVAINDTSGFVHFVDSTAVAVGSVGGVSNTIFPSGVHGVTTTGGDILITALGGNSLLIGANGLGDMVAATGGDVRLAAGSIRQYSSESGKIVANALGIQANGNVDLSEIPNSVSALVSIGDASGFVRFVNSTSFIVGSVGALGSLFTAQQGVKTVGGDIALQNRSGSMQLGNGNSSEVVSATGSGGDVRLESDGGITQSSAGGGAITAAALGVAASGNVDLTFAANSVSAVLAANDKNGFFRFVNQGSIVVGSVGAIPGSSIFPGVVGVRTVNGDIALANLSGNMQLGNGNANEVVSATGSGGDVRLNSAGNVVQSSSGGGMVTAAALGIVAGGNVNLDVTINLVTVIVAINAKPPASVAFLDTNPGAADGAVGAIPRVCPGASGVS